MTTATTLSGLIAEQGRELTDETFLYFEDRVITYGELDRKVNRAANGLAALGARAGVGVSIMMPNSPEWLFTYFATQRLGACAIPVNTGLKGDGLRHIIDHSDSKVLVCGWEYADRVSKIESELTKLTSIVVDDAGAPDDWKRPEAWLTLADVMDAPETDPGIEIDPEAISALMYTSGTTGAPKGVVNRYGGANLVGIRMLGSMLAPDEVLFTCLPLFHANALFLTSIRALVMGRPIVLSRRFSASRFWDEIRSHNATTFNALGAMIPIMMKQPPTSADKNNPVRVVFSAACPASVWAEFEERFDLRIIEGYAAVDGGGYNVINMGNAPKGSIGKPMNQFRVDGGNGNDAAPGVPGELLFKVDDEKLRRVEYYKNEEAGNDRIRDGWFHTGDLVKADEDGNLYFVDRMTDSLRRRGENISSWDVEREINRHPGVLESAVFGVPSELGEHDVMAVVVPRPGETIDPAQLAEFCRDQMASFMVPRYIEISDEIPKTETHRVQKSELKKRGITESTWDSESAPV